MTDTKLTNEHAKFVEGMRKTAKRISEELDAVSEGRAYYYDTPYEINYAEDWEDVPEDAETASMSDYFSETYNEHFIFDGRGRYVAVRLMVACGGPNIWVDTYSKEVSIYWGADTASYPLLSCTCAEIDEFAEMYGPIHCE